MISSHRGIVYVSTGKKYISEALANIALTKKYNPHLPITLVSDIPVSSDLLDVNLLLNNPSFSYFDKIQGLSSLLPYTYNLFLDSDAFAVDNLDELFKMLIPFDISASFAPVSIPPGWCDLSIPNAFPEYNTGVIYLKNSPITRKFLIDWRFLYQRILGQCNQTWDQATFRSVLWQYLTQTKLSFYCLSSSFNIRTSKPWTVSRGQKASIIHGRFNRDELPDFIDFLNHDIDKFRTWIHWKTIFPKTTICPKYDRTNYDLFP